MANPVRRFRAKVYRLGRNACLDIPQEISRAFRSFDRVGKVSVEGTLNEIQFRSTLMPTGGGRHRLYVNGGMRQSGGIRIGDTLSLFLRPAAGPEELSVPPRCRRTSERDPGRNRCLPPVVTDTAAGAASIYRRCPERQEPGRKSHQGGSPRFGAG